MVCVGVDCATSVCTEDIVAILIVDVGSAIEGVAYSVIEPVGTCKRVTAADRDTLTLPLSVALDADCVSEGVIVMRDVYAALREREGDVDGDPEIRDVRDADADRDKVSVTLGEFDVVNVFVSRKEIALLLDCVGIAPSDGSAVVDKTVIDVIVDVAKFDFVEETLSYALFEPIDDILDVSLPKGNEVTRCGAETVGVDSTVGDTGPNAVIIEVSEGKNEGVPLEDTILVTIWVPVETAVICDDALLVPLADTEVLAEKEESRDIVLLNDIVIIALTEADLLAAVLLVVEGEEEGESVAILTDANELTLEDAVCDNDAAAERDIALDCVALRVTSADIESRALLVDVGDADGIEVCEFASTVCVAAFTLRVALITVAESIGDDVIDVEDERDGITFVGDDDKVKIEEIETLKPDVDGDDDTITEEVTTFDIDAILETETDVDDERVIIFERVTDADPVFEMDRAEEGETDADFCDDTDILLEREVVTVTVETVEMEGDRVDERDFNVLIVIKGVPDPPPPEDIVNWVVCDALFCDEAEVVLLVEIEKVEVNVTIEDLENKLVAELIGDTVIAAAVNVGITPLAVFCDEILAKLLALTTSDIPGL